MWNPSLGPYKNAVTNELFITASVSMYLYFSGDNDASPTDSNSFHDVEAINTTGLYNSTHLNNAIKGVRLAQA